MSIRFRCHVHGLRETIDRSNSKGWPCGGCEDARKDAKWDAAFEAQYGRRPTDADRWLSGMRDLLNAKRSRR